MDQVTKYYGAAAQYNSNNNGNRIIKIALLLVGVIAALSIGFALISMLTAGNKNEVYTLIAREQKLLSYLEDYTEYIKSDDLNMITATASTLIRSDITNYSAVATKLYGNSKIPSNTTTAEADTEDTATLDEYSQRPTFDSTYLQIIRDKIAASQSLANKLNLDSSGTLQLSLQQNLINLQSIDNQLAQLNL